MPTQLGKYLLLDCFHEGALSQLWRARSPEARHQSKPLTLKLVPSGRTAAVAVVTDEARLGVQLKHPGLIETFELGQAEQHLYLAREYLPGKDVRQVFEAWRLRGSPAPLPVTCHLIAEAARALHAAHTALDAQGKPLEVVLREVGPQMMLLGYGGAVKVVGFSIARWGGRALVTQPGVLKGRPGYLSPEQVLGWSLDFRTDVFSLGVCLYELLTGELLFGGEVSDALFRRVREADVVPPSRLNPNIPRRLDAVVMKALAREPKDRTESCAVLADELDAFAADTWGPASTAHLEAFMQLTFPQERLAWSKGREHFDDTPLSLAPWLEVSEPAPTEARPAAPAAAPAASTRYLLKEIQAKQVPGEKRRRWFVSSDMDLIVWVEDTGALHSFQLCYGKKNRAEHAVTWKPESGFSHAKVSSGEDGALRPKGAPVLVGPEEFDVLAVLDGFEASRGLVPVEVADFVVQKLRAHPSFGWWLRSLS